MNFLHGVGIGLAILALVTFVCERIAWREVWRTLKEL